MYVLDVEANSLREKENMENLRDVAIFLSAGLQLSVLLYLLYRIETKLDVVVQSIQSLPETYKGQ